MFLGEGVLKICSKFTGEHPCQSVISIHLQSNFTEITLRYGCSINLLLIFCSLHSANNRFGKLGKEIDAIVELDRMAIDFHLLVKYCAGRREDFAKVSEINGILSRHLEKHCTSRWITLDKVLLKLIEQF